MTPRTRETALPVVFFHGFMGSSKDFDAVRKFLPDLQTIAFDMPGHGKRGLPENARYEDVLDELIACLPDRSIVYGYSMGARIALACAERAPSKVAGLFLSSFSPGLNWLDIRELRRAEDAERIRRLENDPETFLADWGGMSIFAELRRRGLDKAIEEARRLHIQIHGVKGWTRCLDMFSPGTMPCLDGALDSLTCPLTVVAGALDAKYQRIAQQLYRQFETAKSVAALPHTPAAVTADINLLDKPDRFADIDFQIHSVKNADHNIHACEPEQTAALLEQFQQSLVVRGGECR